MPCAGSGTGRTQQSPHPEEMFPHTRTSDKLLISYTSHQLDLCEFRPDADLYSKSQPVKQMLLACKVTKVSGFASKQNSPLPADMHIFSLQPSAYRALSFLQTVF